jgi:hypothetical protein
MTERRRYKRLSADLPQHWLGELPYWTLPTEPGDCTRTR